MGNRSSFKRSMSVDLPTPDGPESTNTRPLAGVSAVTYMGFDALTLAAVRDELEPLLTGSRLQRLVMIDELSLAAECFAPRTGRINVLLSADLERARLQGLDQLAARRRA